MIKFYIINNKTYIILTYFTPEPSLSLAVVPIYLTTVVFTPMARPTPQLLQ